MLGIKNLVNRLFKRQEACLFMIPDEQLDLLTQRADEQNLPVELFLAAVLESYLVLIREIDHQAATLERIKEVFFSKFDVYHQQVSNRTFKRKKLSKQRTQVHVPLTPESIQRLYVLEYTQQWTPVEVILHGLITYSQIQPTRRN